MDLEGEQPPGGAVGALAQLRSAAHVVEGLLATEDHPLIRQELERLAESLDTQIRAWATQDTDLLEESLRIQHRALKGLRKLSELPAGTAWLLTEQNVEQWRTYGEPDQVWLRWDHLPVAQRATAASLASYLRDLTGKRKPAGRPRNRSRSE